ncbi:MAG: haloacid dehalogenase type II [Thermoleophilaceae bacterium]|nr:haloacid dehalogenase type II [Thermoleophilaceae bacterium]
MRLSGIAFDAFGTLFDLDGLRGRARKAVGDRGGELYDLLLARLVPSTWHATAAGAYRPFGELAVLALQAAAHELELELSESQAHEIAAGLSSLAAYPDADEALAGLAGRELAVLSNGTREGVQSMVAAAGLSDRFAHLLVADDVGFFKPAPEVYAQAVTAFGGPANSILLVSGNEWDVAGAKLAGLRAAWISRGRRTTRFLGVESDLVAEQLADVPDAVRRLEAA